MGFYFKKKDFIFQWDNDPKHNSKLALEFLRKINLID